MCTSVRIRRQPPTHHNCKGAAAVEFAIVAPVLIVFLLGTIEVSNLCDKSTTLQASLRQSARLAGMDRDGILGAGQTTNEKIIADVQNFLSACGLPGQDTVVTITDPDTGAEMDLDAPEAEFELFELTATIPFGSQWVYGIPEGLTRSYVFRNARGATICD